MNPIKRRGICRWQTHALALAFVTCYFTDSLGKPIIKGGPIARTQTEAAGGDARALTPSNPTPVIKVQATAAPNEPVVKFGDLTISGPWTRQPPDGARVAGGFMRITNTGKTPDRLVGGSAAFAKRVEVHEMAMTSGVMRMRELAKGLEIKPGEVVELKPGSIHIMFMDLTTALKAGARTKVTLVFEKAGAVDVELVVTPVDATKPATGHTHH